MTPLLDVRKLSFGYRTSPVLEEISFAVPAGETVAVLGANGSGKTTLLKICAGLLAPQVGEVVFAGKRLTEYKRRELAKCIALVPQEVQISFDFTVQQLVEQGRTPYLSWLAGSLQQSDRLAVKRAMELASVEHLADRNFNELSGGERQRVKIALGLAQEPQLLLLDEPAQHLDIGRQAEVFSVLHRMNQAGITIMAAVHDLQSAHAHFSSAILLRPNSSLTFGPPASILTPQAIQQVFGVNLPEYESFLFASRASTRSSSLCASSPEEDLQLCVRTNYPVNRGDYEHSN